MTYASLAWAAISKADLHKLVIQNRYLRMITNVHYYVQNQCLHEDLKIEPFDKFITKLNR
ncbi:hypothetical protein X975_11447, partial [Stegodyphus mimosarum]